VVVVVVMMMMMMMIICKFVTSTKSSMLELEARAVARWPGGVC